MRYAAAKYKDKRQWQNYIADCLWVLAVGRTFNDEDGNISYPRWHEIDNPQKEHPVAQITKNDVKAQFLRLKRKTV